MLHILAHTLEHTVADVAGLLPFLFVTYLAMELLEHFAGNRFHDRIRTAGRFGPLWGALLGVVPQCGFSAAAAGFYSGRVISVGTLIAVFLSTSDEMLPILISESVPVVTIAKILAAKVLIACASGFLAEFIYQHFTKRLCRRRPHPAREETGHIFYGKEGKDIPAACGEKHCNCEEGVLLSAVKHTVKIFFYIFVITFVLNGVIEGIGEDALAQVFSNVPVLGQMIAAAVGLIPNCASSVIITQLYLKGVISAGMMMSGLLVNAGIGSLVLIRSNRNVRESAGIIGAVYTFGVIWGIIIDIFGVVF